MIIYDDRDRFAPFEINLLQVHIKEGCLDAFWDRRKPFYALSCVWMSNTSTSLCKASDGLLLDELNYFIKSKSNLCGLFIDPVAKWYDNCYLVLTCIKA